MSVCPSVLATPAMAPDATPSHSVLDYTMLQATANVLCCARQRVRNREGCVIRTVGLGTYYPTIRNTRSGYWEENCIASAIFKARSRQPTEPSGAGSHHSAMARGRGAIRSTRRFCLVDVANQCRQDVHRRNDAEHVLLLAHDHQPVMVPLAHLSCYVH